MRKALAKEFKQDAVSIVIDQGYSCAEAARSGLTECMHVLDHVIEHLHNLRVFFSFINNSLRVCGHLVVRVKCQQTLIIK